MGSREMLSFCAAINSIHWLLTRLLRKKTAFAYNAKTGAVTAQLMSATKQREHVGASCEGRMHSFDHVRTKVRIEIFQKSNYVNTKQNTQSQLTE